MDIESINKMGKELKDILDLDTSPVAVTFISKDKEIPGSIPRLGEELRHCAMMDRVRKGGGPFYAPLEDQGCDIGAASLGMGEACNDLVSGAIYYSLGCFGTIEASKETFDQTPQMPANSVKAIVYSALEVTPLTPDVVTIVADPDRIMKLSQSLLYAAGGRIHSSFASLQSMCVESVAQPFLQERVNLSLGCTGSRVFGGLSKDEMSMGIPFGQMEELLVSLKLLNTK